MSLIGLLTSNLFSAGASQIAQNTQNSQNSQNNTSPFQQIKSEFQQLGQDLQSGNLTAAQSDFTTLSQNLSAVNQSGTTSANAAIANSTISQTFSQLGQDLQSGNLQGAQQDFTNLQHDVQQSASQHAGGRHGHHHHRAESSQASSSNSSSSSSQLTNPIVQSFSALAQDLQAGNLSGAQSAFAALQSDLQQIGGFLTAGSNGISSTAVPSSTGSLNVTA